MALLESVLEQEVIEEIYTLLLQCGYDVEENKEKDDALLYYITKEEKQKILNITHQDVFPEKLSHVLVKRIVGNLFYIKIRSGQLELENLDLLGAVSSVDEGDTSVSFSQGVSDLERADVFVDWMKSYGEDEIRCFRRIKWH